MKAYFKLGLQIFSVGALIVSCKAEDTNQSSKLDVFNGTEVRPADYPWVIDLRTHGAACTGTAISPTILVTAGHCTRGGNANGGGKLGAYLNRRIVWSKNVYKHQEYASLPREVTHMNDLAIGVFPAGTFKHYVPIIGEDLWANSNERQTAFFLGYAGNRILKKGSNTVAPDEEYFKNGGGGTLLFSANNNRGDAVLESGDSGGPLVIKDGTDHYLIGVASGANRTQFSAHVHLYHPSNYSFLKTLKEQHKIELNVANNPDFKSKDSSKENKNQNENLAGDRQNKNGQQVNNNNFDLMPLIQALIRQRQLMYSQQPPPPGYFPPPNQFNTASSQDQ